MTADKKLKEQRDILLRCLNRIGDVFEYQYKRMTPEQLKEMVLHNFNIMNKELVLLEQQEQEEWRRHTITQKVKCVRKGWRGAWDALVSAVTGKERIAVLEDVTFSVYVKGYAELKIIQAESGTMPKAYKQEQEDE